MKTSMNTRPVLGEKEAMRYSNHSARARIARGVAAGLFAASAMVAVGATPSQAAPIDVKWATGPIGSSGGKALVVLAGILNKAMPKYHIDVLPTPGAVTTVKGFALGNYDGYYGSDVAMAEMKANKGRFKGFKSHVKVQPVQSLWCYTLDVGLAIKKSDAKTIKSWKDLTGKQVYTGPLPFDTRLHLKNALQAVGVHYHYKQVDLSTAGSQLKSGSIKGMIIYAAGGRTPPPWIAEASLAVNWVPLNPTAAETATLKKDGFAVEQVPGSNFHKPSVKKVTLLPFYWGFDVGAKYSTDDMVKMLNVIDKHADELAKLDPSFRQIANGKMAKFEHDALESTWKLVPIHPGLAKWLKEKGEWNPKWNANIAKL
jgi:uncharacterized protein